MDVDWNAEVVDQVESHWCLQLRPRLDGLTDHEYFWQPVPGPTISRHGTGSAPVTTIAWRLTHLIAGLAETNGTHFGGPPAHVANFDDAGTAEEALRQLDDAFDHWVEGVRGLGEEGLAQPQGPTVPSEFADAPMVRLILYTSVEVIHHGAEICLLRDLYQQGGVVA